MANLNEVWKYGTDNLVWNVQAAAAGDIVAAGSWDGHVHLLDRKGALLWKHKTNDFVSSVGISRDGDVVVASSYDKHLYVLNRAGKTLFKFKSDGLLRAAAVGPAGESVAAAAWSGTVLMLDKKGAVLWKSELGTNPLSLAMPADGGPLVVGCADKSVRCLDGSGKEIWKLETGSAVSSVAANARGTVYAAGSTDTHIYLMDSDGKLQWRYRTGGVVRGVALSASGEYLVASSHERYLYFFERNGRLLWLSKIPQEVWTVGTSGMCDAIVVGCRDRSVRFFENKEILKIQLDAARTAITRAEEEGADVRDAGKLFRDAEAAFTAGKVEEALAGAGQSKARAESTLEGRLRQQLTDKLAALEKMASELKAAGKSSNRVDWAVQRGRKLMDAGKLRKALDSLRKSETILVGVPPEEPKPLLPEEEGEKVPGSAPAAKVEDQLRPAVEAEFNKALNDMNEMGKGGADVTEPLGLLDKARAAIQRADYFVAAEFISSANKQAQTILKRRDEASARIGEAEGSMKEAREMGIDTGEMSSTLKLAHDAMEAGEYELALDYAGQSLSMANSEKEKKAAEAQPAKAAAPAAAAKADGAPKCPSCGKKVKSQWKSCPFCRTRLK